MQALVDYIVDHSIRGACNCGQCVPPAKTVIPIPPIPAAHSANLVFFPVALNQDSPPSMEALVKLIQNNYHGINDSLNPLDGAFHSFFEIGSWIGDQALALRLIGMGTLLNIWTLLTPYSEFPDIDDEEALRLATNGFIIIATHNPERFAKKDDNNRETILF